ncbi:MAG TPA: cupin domain-containing protein [Candidatus Binataceae bacterium]|nr:cupin domain-containing protein [Candidatus Binataceae bacterium]
MISTPLLSTDTTASGRRIQVPPHPQVIASRLEIAPGAKLPMHEHPYPRYAYVLSGTLEVTTADGKVSRYHAGDFFTEVIGQCHSGRDAGDQPVQLLLIDQVVPGKSNTVPCP